MSADENLLADIADFVHIASTHPTSGVCDGDNDGCGGGPMQIDCEIADDIFDRLVIFAAHAKVEALVEAADQLARGGFPSAVAILRARANRIGGAA